MKTRLKEVMAEAKASSECLDGLLRDCFRIRNEQDVLNKDLKAKEQEWTLKIADDPKSYGANESIRRARFEQENIELFSQIKEKQKDSIVNSNAIELTRGKLSALKFEKDCLIALLSV